MSDVFRFRVEGCQVSFTALPSFHAFDEPYEIEGEHPAEALEKLRHEIDWSIIDAYEGFTITYLPDEDDGARAETSETPVVVQS